MIPQTQPLSAYLAQQDEIDAAVQRVLHSGWYLIGEEVKAFEAEFSQWQGLPHGVAVSNGTDALELALRALNIQQGDEVITTTHTASATVCAIVRSGATPVLVDIDPLTYNLNAEQVNTSITKHTRAIVPVHLYGLPADMLRLMQVAVSAGIPVIEDCAQAHGAKVGGRQVGNFGIAATFSFYPTKNLGALGDGGAVLTVDEAIAQRIRSMAQYGWVQRYNSTEAGMNSRLDEIQAAILRVKLTRLDANNARRREIARRYTESLHPFVTVPHIPDGYESVFHLYVIRTPHRDALREYLHQQDIGTAIQYPVPIHLQSAYRGWLGQRGDFPEAERAANEILSLPLYPEIADEAVQTVIEQVKRFYQSLAIA